MKAEKELKSKLSPDAKNTKLNAVKGVAFQAKYVTRDISAGVITGSMAIPLSIGIAMISDYPIKVGLATVVFACLIGWIVAWFRPGNYIGAPGIAAGLAPVLALGVATFGLENMAFCIFLTSVIQIIIWKFNWQRYLLVIVPTYLVEGLLAGIGLKILLKFFTFTYEIPEAVAIASPEFWNAARIQIIIISVISLAVFLYLFSKFQDTKPAIPYFVLIVGGVIIAQIIDVPMIYVEDVELNLRLPIPTGIDFQMFVYMVLFALMLAVIDVIEQVMSNAAIEKIDPLKRKCNSNNSLLAIWISNLGASFFGGMTNLDGLAKSTTNRLAGAYTKFSVLVIGSIVLFFTINVQYLDYLPKFALAIVMIFTGWKMIAGLKNVISHGPYALILAILCGVLVFKVGIFEGLLIAMAIHSVVYYLIYSKQEKMSNKTIFKRYIDNVKKQSKSGGVLGEEKK